MRNWRWQLLATLFVVSALCFSCGGGGTSSAPDIQQPAGQDSNLMGVGLPSPQELLANAGRTVSGVRLLQRSGSDTDPALPLRNAVAIGSTLLFTPQWSEANPSPAGLALALYRFTVTGYSGALELHLNFAGEPGDSQTFVAIADFPANRWVLLPVDGNGVAQLSEAQFKNALMPGLLELLAVPVVAGTTGRQLTTIRVGPEPGPLQILGVSPTAISEWDNPVFFPALTGAEAVSFTWDFGGLCAPATSIYTGMTPKPNVNNTGDFECSVTAQPASGEPVVFNFTLTVYDGFNAPPQIRAIYPNAGESGALYSPNYMGNGGTPTTVLWDFGGGAVPNQSTEQLPDVTLGAPGAYNASLTLTNNLGTVSKEFTLYVIEPGGMLPPSLFGASVSPSNAFAGTEVELVPLKTGSGQATDYFWEFGPGISPSTSTEENPRVFLQHAGLLRGKVTGSNAAGSSTAEFEISARQPNPPDIVSTNFSTVNSGIPFSAGASVTQSQGGLWLWNFGGGVEPNTSTAASPLVTPGAPGTYSGYVMVSNAAGSDRLDFEFTVVNPGIPVLDTVFGTELTTNILGTLSVWNQGGPATSWQWTFPSGIECPNPDQPYPSVTGLAAGSYNCSVTASNVSGSDSLDFVITVTDMEAPEITSVWPATVISGQSSSFIAATNCQFPMTWTWDFGGGASPNTSTLQFPNVTILAPGTYNGVVTATNEGGTTSFPFSFTVNPAN